MRPSKLRSERQNQYNYLTGEQLQQELKKQIEEKKQQQMAAEIQNQQDILQHYKNYQLGADMHDGEDPRYINDLQNLMANKEKHLEMMAGAGGMEGRPVENMGF